MAEGQSREEIEQIVNNEPIEEVEKPACVSYAPQQEEEVKQEEAVKQEDVKPKSKARAKAKPKVKIIKEPVVEEPVVEEPVVEEPKIDNKRNRKMS